MHLDRFDPCLIPSRLGRELQVDPGLKAPRGK